MARICVEHLDTLRGNDVSIHTTSYFKCMLLPNYTELGGYLPIILNHFESRFPTHQTVRHLDMYTERYGHYIGPISYTRPDACRTYLGVSALCARPDARTLAQVHDRARMSPLNNSKAG